MKLSIILSSPQLAENIGMVARAMYNFNCCDLRIVNPKDENFYHKALMVSCLALENISCKIFSNINTAIEDIDILIALTARERVNNIKVLNVDNDFSYLLDKYNNKKVAIMLGNEKNGLSNSEVKIANYIMKINTNPNFSSLNLAMATSIVCYEYFKLEQHDYSKQIKSDKDLASVLQLDILVSDLINKLESAKFFDTNKTNDYYKYNLANIYKKAELTSKEVNSLIGIHKKLFNFSPKK